VIVLRTLALSAEHVTCLSLRHAYLPILRYLLAARYYRGMTTKHVTILQDDLDGSNASETVKFCLDGVEYEIDLSERNANRLRNSLGDFISHGRRVGGRAKRGTATPPARADRSQTGAMRSWLQEHGHDVSSRGRIPQNLQELYHKAH
jgi:Lsr2